MKAIANEYHSDRLKNTTTCGITNEAVIKLVAIRGFWAPISEGIKAILKANTLIARTMSCQLSMGLL